MPVSNEGRFLRASLDALVAQGHPNLELILSDNASSDDTGSIAREYAERFEWIRYHRFDEDQGVMANFRFVLDEARGEYFMWAAGHDLWSSDYIEGCVAALEGRPEAVLAFGSSRWIDDVGEPLERWTGWSDTRAMEVVARYFTVLWGNMHPIYGVMRTAALRRCPLVNAVGADLVVLAGLALKGEFLHVVDALWSRREFRAEASYADKLKRYRRAEFAMARSLFSKLFPLARLPLELIKGVVGADLPWKKRMAILLLLLPSLPVRYLSGKAGR